MIVTALTKMWSIIIVIDNNLIFLTNFMEHLIFVWPQLRHQQGICAYNHFIPEVPFKMTNASPTLIHSL